MAYKNPDSKRAWNERNKERLKAYWRARNRRLNPNPKPQGDFSTNATGRKPRPLAGAGLQKALAREAEIARIESEGTKTCRACLKVLPIDKFYKTTQKGKLSYFTRCKDCHTDITVEWGRKNPVLRNELNRKSHQRWHFGARQYGISPQEYESMVEAQNGLCAICGKENKRRLCIDHNHKTEQVRDLLCDRCNTAIGQFEDDPELLKLAAEYLERHAKRTK